MKRITTITLIALLTVSLTSCRKLPQDYFENKNRDSVVDATALFESYNDHLKEYYEETYPSHEELYNISSLEDYVTFEKSKTEYNREEFVNYHLTDKRIILGRSDMSAVLYTIDEILLFMKNKCADVKEADFCEADSSSLMFLMEGKALVLEYTITSDQGTRNFVLQFTIDENKVVFEFEGNLKSKRYDELLSTFEMTYKENDYEKSEMYSKTMGQTTEIKHDLKNDTFYRVVRQNGIYYFWYLTDDEQFLINVKDEEKHTLTNEDLVYFSYTKFNDNKIVFEYKSDGEEYFLNLLEIQGWDRVVMNEDFITYSLYNGSEKFENVTVKIEFESGEYAYVKTNNPYNLGFNVPFTLEQLQEKEDYIIENFITIIEESGLKKPGTE